MEYVCISFNKAGPWFAGLLLCACSDDKNITRAKSCRTYRNRFHNGSRDEGLILKVHGDSLTNGHIGICESDHMGNIHVNEGAGNSTSNTTCTNDANTPPKRPVWMLLGLYNKS